MFGTSQFIIVESAFAYDECDRVSVGATAISRDDRHEIEFPHDFWQATSPAEWHPQYVEGRNFPDVPDHIAMAASEAHSNESIGNHMSAILMARTVIEATAKDKGITTGSLAKKIELMLDAGLIRPHVKEAADEVRHFGNDMAHGDITVPVEEDDTAEVLTLMGVILNEVYQDPARTAALRARRLARKEAS